MIFLISANSGTAKASPTILELVRASINTNVPLSLAPWL